MDPILEAFKNTGSLHHAYLIEGDPQAVIEALSEFLERDVGMEWRGNPDLWQQSFETMGIDEARELASMQQNRALGGGRKIFIVSADSLTHEAQNSLLKVLEEPTEGTHFFFLMRSAERLLPTLASRLQVVKFSQSGAAASGFDMAGFLAGTPAARALILKSLIDEKDKSEALAFVAALEGELHSRIDLARASPDQIFALEEAEKGRQYLLDRSPSVKLILEHIAAAVPLMK